MSDTKVPKGRVPKSETATMLTIRFKTHEEYKAVTDYARKTKGISVNEFAVTELLKSVDYQRPIPQPEEPNS